MTQNEIIDTLVEYLDQHLKEIRGHIGRDPYKGDIFKLFADAYRSGYFDDSSRPGLGADALCDILQVRWLANREHEEKRKHLLDQLLPMWREWQYGWDKYPKG
ncbi:MAG: hypothetical protein E6J54_04305 [Deltaproteobacteria bacterium]|jgi:hypothetical protein|nr:MAG: hypothetical protein E6J54_04305 [Deltaproteobacteria bacterium]HEU0048476.1 hypothetical protein [Nitrososphaera sp.]